MIVIVFLVHFILGLLIRPCWAGLGWDLPKLSIPVIFPSSSARAGPNQKLMDCSSKLVPCFSNKMSSNFDSQIANVRYFGQGPLKKPFN